MKVRLLSCHIEIETLDVTELDEVYCGKPTDPDLITVNLKNGKKLFCDQLEFEKSR